MIIINTLRNLKPPFYPTKHITEAILFTRKKKDMHSCMLPPSTITDFSRTIFHMVLEPFSQTNNVFLDNLLMASSTDKERNGRSNINFKDCIKMVKEFKEIYYEMN